MPADAAPVIERGMDAFDLIEHGEQHETDVLAHAEQQEPELCVRGLQQGEPLLGDEPEELYDLLAAGQQRSPGTLL